MMQRSLARNIPAELSGAVSTPRSAAPTPFFSGRPLSAAPSRSLPLLPPCPAAASSTDNGNNNTLLPSFTQPQLPLDASGFVKAGPSSDTPPPDYTAIDAQPLNRVVYTLFRNKMVAALGGKDSTLQGYDAIIDLTRRLNALGPTPRDTQIKTRGILNALFPSWLPGAFKVMFAKPLPEFSCRLNAWATWLTCQWLMGPCEINDVEIDDGKIGVGHGVMITRCRYLEEAGCASICLNSCKVPTQEFFEKDMGLPLTMTPNYEDFSCQFSFGATPKAQAEDEAFLTPCFSGCPTAVAVADAKQNRACHRIEVNE